MTVAAGREMFQTRGRPPVADAENVKAPGIARGRALFEADHDPDTGRATAARAALDAAAVAAAAGGQP